MCPDLTSAKPPGKPTSKSTLMPPGKRKIGRPVEFPPESTWPPILDQIEEGKSLRWILATPGMPGRSVIMKALREDPEIRARYEAACKSRAVLLADEILTISDAPIPEDLDPACRAAHLAQRRLMIDSRKWIAAKLYPKVFGDKTMVEVKDDYRSISIIAAMKQREGVAIAMLREWESEKGTLDVKPRVIDEQRQLIDDESNPSDHKMST